MRRKSIPTDRSKESVNTIPHSPETREKELLGSRSTPNNLTTIQINHDWSKQPSERERGSIGGERFNKDSRERNLCLPEKAAYERGKQKEKGNSVEYESVELLGIIACSFLPNLHNLSSYGFRNLTEFSLEYNICQTTSFCP